MVTDVRPAESLIAADKSPLAEVSKLEFCISHVREVAPTLYIIPANKSAHVKSVVSVGLEPTSPVIKLEVPRVIADPARIAKLLAFPISTVVGVTV